jgi:hypothetical protein
VTVAWRVGLVAVSVVLWFLAQAWLGRRPPMDSLAAGDAAHRLTAAAHSALHRHPQRANALLAGSSLLIDLATLKIIYDSVFGPSFAPFAGLAVLFALRLAVQATCALPRPEGIIWRSPGVPSLFVTYGVSNDLFFSGHTALAVYGALHLAQQGSLPWVLLAGAFVLFESATVLILRAHWTADVYAGAVTALWVHGCVTPFLGPIVDGPLGG